MASERDDNYQRLKSSVDEWVAQVSQTRSVLAQSLKLDRSRRPAFRLISDSAPASATQAPQAGTYTGAEHESDELYRRLADAELAAREAKSELRLAESELEFAREQLLDQVRRRSDAEHARSRAENVQEETVQALGRARIALDELRRKMRGKEWELERVSTELEALSAEAAPVRQVDADAVRRETAALHSRLETLTLELQTARDAAAREHEAAISAEARCRELEAKTDSSDAALAELSQQIDSYAASLRDTGRELDEARNRMQLQAAEGRETDAPAGDLDDLPLATIVDDELAENYDALADSHMTLREEVIDLHARLIERDHRIAELRAAQAADTLPAQQAAAVAAADIAPALQDDDSAAETSESKAIGDGYLVEALRQELEATRCTLERSNLDHSILSRALRAELDKLRDLATEREFVLHHQSEQLEKISKDELMKAAAGELADDGVLRRELELLRERISEREQTIRRLRGELAESEESLAAGLRPEIESLKASLDQREGDLKRARDRTTFLQKLLREITVENDRVKQRETPAVEARTPIAAVVPVKQPELPAPAGRLKLTEIDVSKCQPNARLQREVEQTLTFGSPWPIIAVLAIVGALVLMGSSFLIYLLV